MQTEIDRAMPRTRVRITAINAIGAEAGVASVVMGRTLPLVQDDMTANVAARWGAQVRQLWVCDAAGRVLEVTDLTSASLGETMNYNAVRDRLLALAR
jgi:hypothetical protein